MLSQNYDHAKSKSFDLAFSNQTKLGQLLTRDKQGAELRHNAERVAGDTAGQGLHERAADAREQKPQDEGAAEVEGEESAAGLERQPAAQAWSRTVSSQLARSRSAHGSSH